MNTHRKAVTGEGNAPRVLRIKGYKGTDENMRCAQGFQFELGKWHEHKGDLELCKSGFHFCEQPSGPYCYGFKRVFECEAEDVLQLPKTPGADYKLVCSRIRLVKEVSVMGDGNTGDRNTGNWNTGDRNTGDRNTGDGNTGDRNTGDRNTGDWNTGDWNTGHRNTGDRNTGNWNTGYGNTGDGNTGYWNTGDRNTGYGNTGDRNTGYGNVTNNSSGFFCAKEPTVICFDKQTRYTRAEFYKMFPEYDDLCSELFLPSEIEFSKYKRLPGITRDKLKKLHKLHLEARNLKQAKTKK